MKRFQRKQRKFSLYVLCFSYECYVNEMLSKIRLRKRRPYEHVLCITYEWDLESVCALCISYEYAMKSLLKKGKSLKRLRRCFQWKKESLEWMLYEVILKHVRKWIPISCGLILFHIKPVWLKVHIEYISDTVSNVYVLETHDE